MAEPHHPPHAGVRIDPEVVAGISPEAHERVEPIPWKTGRVGVVPSLDTVAPVAPVAASPVPAQVAAPSGASPAVPVAPAPPKAKKKLPGSGIPPRRIAVILKWSRRVSQFGFFALFMYFLFQTGFRGSFAARADAPVRLPLPVEGFLLADPFVAAMTALATHTIYRGLLWSLGLLALTMVVGRVFCGWICPFGTLHHFFGWLLPS
jgi:hypothetical protein